MLQFIESNPKYFERNIQHVMETYKKSTEKPEKSSISKQLQTVCLSFRYLFDQGRDAEFGNGWLTQHYPTTQVVNTSTSSIINLQYRPELRAQISRIEAWFNQRLEKSITEITSPGE